MNRPIFIIGFMGAGKTTLAKELAKIYKVDHRDSDEEIARNEGISIQEIFHTYGESYFRNLEKNWLETIDKVPAVISCGGGMPCFHDNILKMKRIGEVIYLNVSNEELINRVKMNNSRPLLIDKSVDDIIELKKRREKLYYSMSDRIIYSLEDLI